MQCLPSPTRTDINRAHVCGDWVDVGVVSMRNLRRINWRRTVLWWVLALSSLPIHLLYNYSIFKTLAANEYFLMVANTDFLKGDSFAPFYMRAHKKDHPFWWTTDIPMLEASALRDVQLQFSQNNDYADNAKVHNLTASECISAYGKTFVSDHRNVIAITSAKGNQTNNTLLYTEWIYTNPEKGFVGLTYG